MIEPDLVATKDGVLIARYAPNMVATTDVATKFPGRKRKAIVDGVEEEGYFASDFTLAEIKTLLAIQAFADRSQAYNGLYQIPTFDEVLDLVRDKSTRAAARSACIRRPSTRPTTRTWACWRTEGPLTAGQLRQIRKQAPQGKKRSVRSSLFEVEPT